MSLGQWPAGCTHGKNIDRVWQVATISIRFLLPPSQNFRHHRPSQGSVGGFLLPASVTQLLPFFPGHPLTAGDAKVQPWATP